MLNAILTVDKGVSNSHKKTGWAAFTDHVIKTINDQCEGVVFVLWGLPAQQKASSVDHDKHFVLKACHPSPLSATKGNFFACAHFSKINAHLVSLNKKEIDWALP